MNTENDNISFHIPVDIEKATKEGKEVMSLKGLAGDGGFDGEGESLDYNSFNLDRMYYVNWEHGKDPDDVVGIIAEKELKKGGMLYIKTDLFEDSEKSKSIWNLAKSLAKKGHRLGYSVEGKVVERDPLNPKKIKKAELYGVAICKVPVNPTTYADIVKSFSSDVKEAEKKKKGKEDKEEEDIEKWTLATWLLQCRKALRKAKEC